MWRLRWKTSYGFFTKLRLMIDIVGDLIIGLSASIAAGSGLSAWRLLRRVKNLERQYERLYIRVEQRNSKDERVRQRFNDQAIFNQVLEDRVEALEDKPAPKQEKKMGTPRPKTAKGFLYGRTPNGP